MPEHAGSRRTAPTGHDAAIEFGVGGTVHGAHAVLAERGHDAVMGDGRGLIHACRAFGIVSFPDQQADVGRHRAERNCGRATRKLATGRETGIYGQSVPVLMPRFKRPCGRADASLSHIAGSITTRTLTRAEQSANIDADNDQSRVKASSNKKKMQFGEHTWKDLTPQY